MAFSSISSLSSVNDPTFGDKNILDVIGSTFDKLTLLQDSRGEVNSSTQKKNV